MEHKKDFSPQDSLQLIESMINQARNRISENGHLYLVWGWVILCCSLIHFTVLYVWHWEPIGMIWGSTWLVLIYQFFYLRKHQRKERVRTYTDELEGYIWITFAVLLFLCIFLMGKNNAFSTMYPVILILYGMPTFLTGALLRFKPLRIGGIACWILAVLAFYTPFQFQLLLIAAAITAGWIIPGYLLRAQYKQQQS